MIPSDHYWRVNGNSSQVFSSASGAFVADDDPAFLSWQTRGISNLSKVATNAHVMASLWRVNEDFPGLVARCKVALGNPACRRRFKPGEFLAELTAADAALIKPALDANTTVWLRWQQMLAWIGPLDNKTAPVQNFFAWLVTVLGQPRVTAIKAGLGLINGN